MAHGHALHPQPHVVVEVVGGDEDRFVTRFGEGGGSDAERLVAAGGDEDPVGGNACPVLTRELGGECLPQRGEPWLWRVPPPVGLVGDLCHPGRHLRSGWERRRCLREVEQWPLVGALRDQGVGGADGGVDQ